MADSEGTRPEGDGSGSSGEAPRVARVATSPAAEGAAPAEIDPQLAQLIKAALHVDWEHVELDCPPAFLECVGAELQEAEAVIKCDCGALIRVYLDGQTVAGCPKCHARYRHLVVIQGEAWAADGCALAVKAVLEENV
jgi:hypothetical protein